MDAINLGADLAFKLVQKNMSFVFGGGSTFGSLRSYQKKNELMEFPESLKTDYVGG